MTNQPLRPLTIMMCKIRIRLLISASALLPQIPITTAAQLTTTQIRTNNNKRYLRLPEYPFRFFFSQWQLCKPAVYKEINPNEDANSNTPVYWLHRAEQNKVRGIMKKLAAFFRKNKNAAEGEMANCGCQLRVKYQLAIILQSKKHMKRIILQQQLCCWEAAFCPVRYNQTKWNRYGKGGWLYYH